jgi:hypothetical protein
LLEWFVYSAPLVLSFFSVSHLNFLFRSTTMLGGTPFATGSAPCNCTHPYTGQLLSLVHLLSFLRNQSSLLYEIGTYCQNQHSAVGSGYTLHWDARLAIYPVAIVGPPFGGASVLPTTFVFAFF